MHSHTGAPSSIGSGPLWAASYPGVWNNSWGMAIRKSWQTLKWVHLTAYDGHGRKVINTNMSFKKNCVSLLICGLSHKNTGNKKWYSSLNLLPDCLKTHMCCARGPMLELEQNLWNERKIKDRIPISPTKTKVYSCAVCLGPAPPLSSLRDRDRGVCVCRGRLFATPWAVARQVPLSLGFSRQESWSGQPSRLQGIFLTRGSHLHLPLLHCRQILHRWAFEEAHPIPPGLLPQALPWAGTWITLSGRHRCQWLPRQRWQTRWEEEPRRDSHGHAAEHLHWTGASQTTKEQTTPWT